jgi:hypothetical protein
MVEMAAMVGSMKSRSALNICFVSVAFNPPETNIAMITSSRVLIFPILYFLSVKFSPLIDGGYRAIR